MEYSESLDKAGEYARSAFSRMESKARPATANTFAVWFVYYPGRRPDLSRVPLTVGGKGFFSHRFRITNAMGHDQRPLV